MGTKAKMDNSRIDIIEKIKEILMKKAEGYSYQEVIEEYQTDEKGEKKVEKQMVFPSFEKEKSKTTKKEKLILTKKKVTTLFQPPDLSAIKMLLDMFITDNKSDLEKMSNEELLSLKDELIEKLKEIK